MKLVVGPITKGLKTDVKPFYIDNDSFPTLINAYQWRKRIRRKRGTKQIGRLRYWLGNTDGAGAFSTTILPIPLTHGVSQFTVSTTIFTDSDTTATASVNLLTTGAATATLNRTTGALAITGAALSTAVYYYPGLPVMGLEPFVLDTSDNPQEVCFDTNHAYNLSLSSPFPIHGVSYYNNPATGAYTGYTQKGTFTALNWNMQDYQQIWTTNYQGALWSTPGITAPYTTTNVGMQFKPIVTVTIVAAGPPAIATLEITGHGLVVGDFVFVNEVATTTGINWQTGYVTTITDVNNVQVTFLLATIANAGTGGIAQYLTSNSNSSKDCLRWYNGAPINSSNAFQYGAGWVNFAPPLVTANFGNFSVGGDLPPALYYLVGARMIVPYKDRLLFLGPLVQTSTGSPIYLQDTVIYSQNGTPYYTASFAYSTVNPSISTIVTTTFTPILTPTNQSAYPFSFVENADGFGGFISAGYARPITSVSPNEDALIVGFADRQARLLYTGNDSVPFNFYIINSELGSDATFSTITLDRGVLSVGGRGIILTSQIASQRIDLDIIDKVFEIRLKDQGSRRICAQRDFINEVVFFTVPSNEANTKYPSQTLQYNYREDTWGIFNETYTTYGTVRFNDGDTWATWTSPWTDYTEPWNAGQRTILQPVVISGNQQGYVMQRTEGTGEEASLNIQNISGSTVTSPSHGLEGGDYFIINSVQGTLNSQVNGKIFSAQTVTTDTIVLSPPLTSGTYLGGGTITRMYVPYIQTKQFPAGWELARKTRIGPMQFLITTTNSGTCELLIFLSENSANAYNTGAIVPDPASVNNSLIYSTTLYTSPEYYQQISTDASLGSVGNGVSVAYTFNYSSLFGINYGIVPGTIEITIGSVATFSDNGDGTLTGTGTGTTGTVSYTSGIVVLNFSVAPTSQASTTDFNTYYADIQNPTSIQQAQIWHRMNTSLIGDTIQIGFTFNDDQMRDTNFGQQFAEFEIHGMVLEVNPSGLLA